MPLKLLSWRPHQTSFGIKTATEEHRKNGCEAIPSPIAAGMGGQRPQHVSPAILSLAKQLLEMHAPVGPHLCDFVVGVPEGAVLRPTMRQVVLILVVSFSYLQIGINFAWPNALATGLNSDNSTIFNNQLHFTPVGMDLVGSLLFSGFMVGVLPGGWILGWLGRRLTLTVTCLPTAFGWLLITFAHNSLMIFTGRFICGISMVMMYCCTKIYVAEVTNISYRGMASTFLEIMKFLGLVLVAAAATKVEWYTIACINGVLVILYSGIVLALPETPAFLAVQNKEEEARKVLQLIRGPKADVDAELALLKLRNERKDGNSGWTTLFKPDMLKKIAVLFVLLLMRDFCGSDVIVVHITRMLLDEGVTLDHNLSTLIITLVGLCGVIILSAIVDRIGRRWCLLASFFIMAVGYTMLGFYSYFLPPPPPLHSHHEIILLSPLDTNATVSYQPEASDGGEESRLFPFFCFMGIAFANAIGVANVPLLVCVEYFPTSVRAQGLSLCLLWMSIMTMIAVQLYSTLLDAITLSGLYWGYALFAAGGMLHTFFFVRETCRQDIG